MQHAAYLSTSRHGIFYFRLPIPAAFHSEGRRSDVMVSLGTRSPSLARHLSKLMISAGQSLSLRASWRAMRHQEIRQNVQDHYPRRHIATNKGPTYKHDYSATYLRVQYSRVGDLAHSDTEPDRKPQGWCKNPAGHF